LYLSNEQYYENGYAGNIDWNRTVNKSNKIIQKKGVIFFPFTIKRTRDKSVFISECMNYVLSDASRYKKIINTIMPYEYINKNNIFNNLRYVLNELKKIRNLYFKDIEKRLINNLIEYIEWKSTTRDNIRLITLKFENYWEIMINEYLNDGFCGIEEDQIIWGENKQNKFSKPEMEYVESVEKRLQHRGRSPYKIQYDHIFIDDDNHKIVLFDSKYFNAEVDQLNYKQLFYHYNLKQKYPEFLIYNGLLLPTEKNYYTKIHVDRTDLDGVKIVEHYINLNSVLEHYSGKI
ncbi:TPA: LlaJI family restriction endonuclease, partial [Streptococcus agalactiae]